MCYSTSRESEGDCATRSPSGGAVESGFFLGESEMKLLKETSSKGSEEQAQREGERAG